MSVAVFASDRLSTKGSGSSDIQNFESLQEFRQSAKGTCVCQDKKWGTRYILARKKSGYHYNVSKMVPCQGVDSIIYINRIASDSM